MRIPEDLIRNFITSEFDAKLNSSGEYTINSIYIQDVKRKLYINGKDGRFICFKSGESGSFLKFVRDYLGLNSINEALHYLAENYSFNIETAEQKAKEEINNNKIFIEFLNSSKPKLFKNGENLEMFGKIAYKYVLDRKLNETYYPKLGYCWNPDSRFHQRIFIPFYENGEMVYAITRSIEKDAKIRYLNVPKLDSKQYVFNIDNVDDTATIVEGTFDAMSMVPEMGAVSMLSADIGTKQMEKLFEKKVSKIIYVPDNDETGHRTMEKNIKKIIQYCPYNGLEFYIYNLPSGIKDFNELKQSTGKDYILKKECEKYGNNLFSRSIF